MKSSDMPWPGDEGEKRWEQAWAAIKKVKSWCKMHCCLTWTCQISLTKLRKSQVWASKWNERAYFSTRKVKLDHDYLCMAVLVQEVINADYAFVIHTTNPSSGDSSEIYAEVKDPYSPSFQLLTPYEPLLLPTSPDCCFLVSGCQRPWWNSCRSISWSVSEFHLQEKQTRFASGTKANHWWFMSKNCE